MFAYKAKQAGKQVLVIDKRPQLGGNIACKHIGDINVHQYGAHIFHTSNREVWDFVNSFVPFNRYTNSPMANYKGKLFKLPFNTNTFYTLWGVSRPEEAQAKIEQERQEAEITEARNLEEQAISLVGKTIYELLIKGYTEKQWGRSCDALPAFIIKRLPVRFTFDNNYFDDDYQGIPKGGYNKLIDGLLADIETKNNTDFLENRAYWKSIADKIVYTGRIDEFFSYRYGALEYRSLRFETQTLDCANYQGNAVVNYTDRETPYTRIIEHKHFEAGNQRQTVITKEYPLEWKEGAEPFYPINNESNMKIYARYQQLAEHENVLFGGRLGEYRYYDMDEVIESALQAWARTAAGKTIR